MQRNVEVPETSRLQDLEEEDRFWRDLVTANVIENGDGLAEMLSLMTPAKQCSTNTSAELCKAKTPEEQHGTET